VHDITRRGKTDALYQGTTLETAERLWFLKGTGFCVCVRTILTK